MEVDHQYVYIEPVSTGGVRGFGWGYPGWGWGWGFRPWVPIALAGIGGFALGAALFWI